MNKLILSHQFTPPSLKEINHQIEEILSNEELDSDQFLLLVSEREKAVNDILRQSDENLIKQFAEKELEINEILTAQANNMLSESLGQLTSLIRGKKAVKQYK